MIPIVKLEISTNGIYEGYRLYGNEEESRVKMQILERVKRDLEHLHRPSLSDRIISKRKQENKC
jgi:hypothetical protein